MKAKGREWKIVLAVFAVVSVLAFAGCKKQSPEVADETALPGTGGANLEDVIALWSHGEQDTAAQEFLLLDWQSEDIVSEGSVFKWTEGEVVSGSRQELENKRAEIESKGEPLRHLCRYVLEQGRQAAGVGDYDSATRNFRAVLDCGQFLVADPETVLLVQAYGKGFIRNASEELEKLE